jgi:hypothetical protein
MCGLEKETMYHCMLTCEHAISFWDAAAELPNLYSVTWDVDILDFSLIKKRDVATTAILVMWAIWNSTNKYAYGDAFYQLRKAIELVDEFIRALDMPKHDVPKHIQKHKWKPPESGFVKMNTDGAVHCGVAGAGMVVRDNKGLLLGMVVRDN